MKKISSVSRRFATQEDTAGHRREIDEIAQ
jgi:hypothetical protein